ncbi:MAG: DUF2934 domain-containing protein [Bryobacteraceae bacterium]
MRDLPIWPNCEASHAFCLPGAADGTIRALATTMRESDRIAVERQGSAAHAHRTGAEHHGKEDHPTGHESSRQALEHSNRAYLNAQNEHPGNRHEHGPGVIADAPKEQDVAAFAHRLWQERGCPEGSPEEDWFRAVEALRRRH